MLNCHMPNTQLLLYLNVFTQLNEWHHLVVLISTYASFLYIISIICKVFKNNIIYYHLQPNFRYKYFILLYKAKNTLWYRAYYMILPNPFIVFLMVITYQHYYFLEPLLYVFKKLTLLSILSKILHIYCKSIITLNTHLKSLRFVVLLLYIATWDNEEFSGVYSNPFALETHYKSH